MNKLLRIQFFRFSIIKDLIDRNFPKGLQELPVLRKGDENVRKLNPYKKDDFYAESVAKDQAHVAEAEQDLNQFEKIKLKELDSLYGTSTYYHDIQPNEMRLDSEHIMNLKMLERLVPGQFDIDFDRFITYDPQREMKSHGVRSPSNLLRKLETKMSKIENV